MADEDSLAEEQDEKYEELRAEGMDKEEAANEAADPETTEARAEEGDEAE